MQMSLEIVVVAIVIFVVALVVLTLFGAGILPFGSLTDFRNTCRSSGKIACEATGNEPINWGQSVNKGGKVTSCLLEVGSFSSCCPKSGTLYSFNC